MKNCGGMSRISLLRLSLHEISGVRFHLDRIHSRMGSLGLRWVYKSSVPPWNGIVSNWITFCTNLYRFQTVLVSCKRSLNASTIESCQRSVIPTRLLKIAHDSSKMTERSKESILVILE